MLKKKAKEPFWNERDKKIIIIGALIVIFIYAVIGIYLPMRWPLYFFRLW